MSRARKSKKLTVWQRRFLRRHYRCAHNGQLAHAIGASAEVVRRYLEMIGAKRSPSDERRIAQRSAIPLPAFVSPSDVMRRVIRVRMRELRAVDVALVAGVFVLSLGLYAATAARAVTGEDAGELIGAAHELGVPHPPGYPLWTIVAHAADRLIPWGTVAWRVSMVSAIFSAAANALLLMLMLQTLRSRGAALVATSAFAVSIGHWSQAVIPEVYGLSTFFVVLSIWLWARLTADPSAGRLVALAFVSGLACTNHTTAFVVGALLAVATFVSARHLLSRPRVILAACSAAFLPLCAYLLLPVFSNGDPYVDWGDPETLDALWEHISRAQYAGKETAQSASVTSESYFRRLELLGEAASEQFGHWIALVIAAAGFIALLARQPALALLIVAIAWTCSVGITQYTQYQLDRAHIYANRLFFIPAWLGVAWFIGGGLDLLMRELPRRMRLVVPVAGVAAALSVGVQHAETVDRSDTTVVSDYGRMMLDTMREGALYFPSSDHSTFPVMYWQCVHGKRPDVVFADKYGRVFTRLVRDALDELELEYVAADRLRRREAEEVLIRTWDGPIYFANPRDMSDVAPLTLEAVGPLWKVMQPEEASEWWAPDEHGDVPGVVIWTAIERAVSLDVGDRQHNDITVQMIRSDLLSQRGIAYLASGNVDEALATWECIEADLAPLKQTYNNIGSTLAEHRLYGEARTYFEAALNEDASYHIALDNLAAVCRSSGDLDAAAAFLTRALDVVDSRGGRLRLGQLHEERGDWEAALRVYEEMALSDRRDARPWVEGGRLMAELGDHDKAIDALEHALALQPLNETASKLLARLEMDSAQWVSEPPPQTAMYSTPGPGAPPSGVSPPPTLLEGALPTVRTNAAPGAVPMNRHDTTRPNPGASAPPTIDFQSELRLESDRLEALTDTSSKNH